MLRGRKQREGEGEGSWRKWLESLEKPRSSQARVGAGGPAGWSSGGRGAAGVGMRAASALGALETWAQTWWAGSCSPARRGLQTNLLVSRGPPAAWGQCRPSGPLRAARVLPSRSSQAASRRAHLHQRVGDLVVDLLREVVHEVGAVEGELLGRLVGGAGVLDEALAARRVHRHHGLAVQLPLPLVHGAAAHHHLHRLRGHRAGRASPGGGQTTARQGTAGRLARGTRREQGAGGRAGQGAGPRGGVGAAEGGLDASRGLRASRRTGAGAAASSRGRVRLSPRPGPGGKWRIRAAGAAGPKLPAARLPSGHRGVRGCIATHVASQVAARENHHALPALGRRRSVDRRSRGSRPARGAARPLRPARCLPRCSPGAGR